MSLSSSANLSTLVICGFIVVLFAWGWYKRSSIHAKDQPIDEITDSLPGVTVSLGVLGTFLGIYIGLFNFNPGDISGSIPTLLDGLKTAFITSIFGMFFSLWLRYIYGRYDNIEADSASTASKDQLALLRTIAGSLVTMEASITAMGETVVKCFRSDEEYSLLSQLKLIRSDMNDLGRDVRKSLDEFGKKVAELGTEALVKSLREVIEQFNAKLSDLVGAEFQQLRDAMIKLTEWQDHHRRVVDEMQGKLEEHLRLVRESTILIESVAASVEQTRQHLEEIDGSLAGMSVSAEAIAAHIEALKGQNAQLASLLTEIQRIGADAKLVLPSISTHVNEAVVVLSAAVTDAQKKLQESGVTMGQAVEGVSGQMLTLTTKHSAHVDQSLKTLAEGLDKALNTSLTSLGEQLASLSHKFVQDYLPLTERLREIVRLAEQVKPNGTA